MYRAYNYDSINYIEEYALQMILISTDVYIFIRIGYKLILPVETINHWGGTPVSYNDKKSCN